MTRAHGQKSESSSQRKLGSNLTLEPCAKSKIKMDPSLRWDDVKSFHCHEEWSA